MPLDPSIASGGTPIQIQDPVNRLAALLQAQGLQQKNAEGALALQTQQRALDESNRLRDVLSQPGFDPNNADHQRQLVAAAPQAGPAFLKANADYAKTKADTNLANSHAQFFGQEAIQKALANTAPYLNGVNSPEGAATWLRGVYADPVLGPMAARLAPIDEAIKGIPQDAAGLQQWKMAHANITPEKLIEMTQAKPTEVNNGQVKSFRDLNPLSPTYGQDTGGAPVQLQATPGEVLSSDTTKRGQNMTSATAAARLKFDKDQAATNQDVVMDPLAVRMAAQQYLAGDTSVLQNFGRGAQGAQNLNAVRAEIARQATEAGMNGADIAAKVAEFGGVKAGQRTAGTRSASIEIAANEAASLAPLALDASAKVARSGFMPFGKAQIMFDTNTNDPNLRQFALANTALVNAYGQVMARGGAASVSDKEHAREMLSTAFDQPSYAAAVQQLQKEIEVARKAPDATRRSISAAVTGKGEPAPAATKGGATVSNW
jgi:hypothetical protein